MEKKIITKDPWLGLQQFTNARIALGSVGTAIPQTEVLRFKLAHAQTKDAIVCPLDSDDLKKKVRSLGLPVYEVQSRAVDRNQYLARPDLGRQLNEASRNALKAKRKSYDVVFVLADGLSATAVNTHGVAVLHEFLNATDKERSYAVVLAHQARVALGDEIAQVLGANFVVICIGERPGLSSSESMGIYTTYQPAVGFTDERRNCISNIHENGLTAHQAALLLTFLIQQSYLKKTSGVAIKVDLKELLG